MEDGSEDGAEEEELQTLPNAERRMSRGLTQPIPVTRRTSKWGGVVEVGWTFFKDAAAAKDRIIDLERELKHNEEKYEELNEKFERMQLRAEGAVMKQKMLQSQLTETQKELQDHRDMAVDLHQRLSETEARAKSLQTAMEASQQDLKGSHDVEAHLRFELRRALREEERVGSHEDLLAATEELRRTKLAMRRQEENLQAAEMQLRQLRQEILYLRCQEKDPAEMFHVQCRDCEFRQGLESKLSQSDGQKRLEAALAESLRKQEELRWELTKERREHEDLKVEHNGKMLEARQEATQLRKSLLRQKEGRWRGDVPVRASPPEESLPVTSPLWRPSPETKLRLQELLPLKHVKTRTEHIYPKLAQPVSAR
ncbi:unnamed protein product [Effrenium voratum]|nr:unnamed protein product [Effrenium voratum]